MAKVILMCGKICTGKSSYADKIRKDIHAVLFSIDEITLTLFGQEPGEKLNEYVALLQKYLLEKSAETVQNGINVIIDTGLWTKRERQEARNFYHLRNIKNEIHYLDISDEEWKRRIQKRNAEIREGVVSAYYIDEGLMKKANASFERPDRTEIDVWIE